MYNKNNILLLPDVGYFKVNKNQVIEPETNLILTVEVDKIKLNPKNKEYSIVLYLSKIEFV